MQIKNKIILYFFIIFFSSNLVIKADEFNISAKEITFDKNNNVITGKGEVEVTDKDGKVIKSDKVIYKKENEFLTVEGSVEFFDTLGNILKTDKATYDKKKEIVNAYKDSELKTEDGYIITSKNIVYNIKDKILSSNESTILVDSDKNTAWVSMFQYNLREKLFSSVGDIKITDINKNKYFFKELHINTKEKEMIGSDVSVLLDPKDFGVKETNDPRFIANDIFISKNKSVLSKGVFTVCPIKKGECPPWLLKAKKITHDKIKKTIYYEHASLKFYDIPIFYFPKFFHPDPTIKRQSGLLSPIFTDSTSIGFGFGLPYYWAISNDRDLTFTPKIYGNENPLFLNEYRQAFKNGFLILDTSYTEGYKKTDSTKTDGSRNHVFGELNYNFNDDDTYLSQLSLKVQKTSNDTYFRIHDINTALVDSSITNLKSEIKYSYEKDDTFFDISSSAYEDLRKNTNSRYEFVVPNILFGKSFFTEKFGTVSFKTNALHRNYEVDKRISSVTNDVVWNSNSFITPGGFINSVESIFKNTNYEAKNTSDYKTKGIVNEFSGVLSYKSSLPMKKEKDYSSNIFSPTFMVRYSPGHMRNLSGDDINLKYANLYSVNKTSVIESGLSGILGFDFKINNKESDGAEKEKFSLSLGQVFNIEENEDLPSKSSLDQQTSDIVGEIKYNFSKIGSIDYKFSVDHNLGELNYNEISSGLNFGKVKFNLNYLEEQNHIGDEHYVNAGVDLNLNENNKLSFETRKNFKTESTELYDISYQYMMDCLSAGLVFRREFYEDSDIEANDTLMFTIKFVPLGGVKAPAYSP